MFVKSVYRNSISCLFSCSPLRVYRSNQSLHGTLGQVLSSDAHVGFQLKSAWLHWELLARMRGEFDPMPAVFAVHCHISVPIYDATRCRIKIVWLFFNRNLQAFNAAVLRDVPLFQTETILSAPEIILHPNASEIDKISVHCIRDCVEVTKVIIDKDYSRLGYWHNQLFLLYVWMGTCVMGKI